MTLPNSSYRRRGYRDLIALPRAAIRFLRRRLTSEADKDHKRISGNAATGHAATSIAPLNQDTARSTTTEVFRLILRRDPEETALAAYSHALLTGKMAPLEMVRELIELEEFGRRAQYHPAVARHLAGTVITTLMERDPGEEAISSYTGAIINGYTLDSFLRELINSEEFTRRNGKAPSLNSQSLMLSEVASLAEQLIVAHMINEGVQLAAPPQRLQQRTPVSESTVRAMLHTLAMLAHTEDG